jgi:hypothetical protein
MNCIICNNLMQYYFSKNWEMPFKVLLESADFYRCENCGFTISKTVYDLNVKDWEILNFKFHNYIENLNNPKQANQPPYIEQALMLNILIRNNIINGNHMVDYGAGIGTLSKLLNFYFDIQLSVFDPYIKNESNDVKYLKINEIGKRMVVFCSAIFEHITKREHLDEINSYVKDDGVLIIHTVVCENIPNDSNWFYINPPVHSSLHTNKSMTILMKQYNYVSSIYCPSSKCWILFKKESKGLNKRIKEVNKQFQTEYLVYKKGFMDYWKGF